MQIDAPLRNRQAEARFSIRLATKSEDVEAAQRLRWSVFAEEQGASLTSPVPGLDIDAFDAHCEHLLVRDLADDLVIGTYRLLTAAAAQRIGGYYSEQEFDISDLAAERGGMLEIGRSCVHPAYRTGATIALLWSGLAGFLVQSGHTALIGCASIPLRGQEEGGARLARELFRLHPSDTSRRVSARTPLPFAGADGHAQPAIPPLIKGYIRSGAVVCGEPCWDPDFNTADIFVYLGLSDIEQRYARRFLQPAFLDRLT